MKDEIKHKFSSSPKLKTKLSKIQYLLQTQDYPIFERLNQLNLETIYLLRWLRLLFLREVPLGLVSRLWDYVVYSISAFGDLEYLDYVVLQFYNAKRNDILSKDYNVIMRSFSTQSFETFSMFELENFMMAALKQMPRYSSDDSANIGQLQQQQHLVQPLGEFQKQLIL